MSRRIFVWWLDADFWLGTIKERRDFLTQGRSFAEAKENLRDACELMTEES